MILSFDKFERYEVPQVTLCNPNSRATEVDGKTTITDTVGVLSNPKGTNLKLNFNAPHELSFDYYKHKSSDPIKQSFYDSIYEAIQTDRYIYLTDIGYFIISSVADSDEGNIDKKSISLKSCEENELATAEGLYLEEGTYYLHTEDNKGLLDLFLPKTAGWTMGYIDPSLLTKPYYVEETEVDNGYNFLYTIIQDMFECIVEPNIIKRTISVYSRVYYAEHHLTDIHIAKYNLLKHKVVEENDEDKYTALNIQGKDENLEIRTVNPTGKNVIYNFEPRYAWMSKRLQEAIEKWQKKCESVEEEYLTLQQGYYTELEKLFNEEQNIEVLKDELKTLEETRDAVIITVGDQQSTALSNVNTQIANKQNEINIATSTYNTHKSVVHTNYEVPINQINKDCALDVTAVDIDGNIIFTVELLNELMTHIKPTDYVDEYMIVTESMTYSQRFEKAKELMDRAQSQLVKISSGQKTYSIDTRSFLFNKQFKHFSEQLCAGAIIYVETKKDTMEQLHLTGIDINFDEKSTNFTLGNKYDRSDLKALYEDALGQNSKSFSELKYIASIIENQQKQLDYQRNWVADLRTLTLDNVLTSEDQAIEINNRGLIGRKRQLNEDGSWATDENDNPLFELEQVKLINNTLVFTKDNWNTASTAVGKIAVGYNPDGSVKYAYGINGQVLIGELILGNNLVLTGTSAGIKIKDSNRRDVFYADNDGNLVLIGKITAKTGNIGGWNIETNYLNNASIAGVTESQVVGISPGIYFNDKGEIDTSHTGDNGDSLCFWAGAPVWVENGQYWHGRPNEAVFRVYKNGKLYATDATINGNITATTGFIGGWNITSNSLQCGSWDPSQLVFISQGQEAWSSYWGTNNWLLYFKSKFGIDVDGNLYAANATIEGHITASSGRIGGWTIEKTWAGAADGETKLYSSIWDVAHSGIGMAVDSGIGNPAFWAGCNPTFANDGTYCGDPWQLSGYGFNWEERTKFYVTRQGHLHASDATITGTINAGSNIYIGKDNGCIYAGSQGQIKYISATGETVGQFIIKNQNASINLLATHNLCSIDGDATLICDSIGNRSCWIDNNEGTFYVNTLSPYSSGKIVGTWTVTGTLKGNSSGTIVSDVNKKNTIQLIDEQYSLAFDNFHPVTYKYNDGTSDRLHTGFIAQEVKKALDTANISTKDFAGLVIFDQGESTEEWTLRYEEFIALNTWQIQKAKSRITELENKVAELKTQIQNLTAG